MTSKKARTARTARATPSVQPSENQDRRDILALARDYLAIVRCSAPDCRRFKVDGYVCPHCGYDV